MGLSVIFRKINIRGMPLSTGNSEQVASQYLTNIYNSSNQQVTLQYKQSAGSVGGTENYM